MDRRSSHSGEIWWAMIFVALTSVAIGLPRNLFAQEPQSAESRGASLFGPATIAYLEVARPAQLLDQILDHPLRERVEALPPVSQFFRSPEGFAAQAFLGLLEGQLEMSWREALQRITRHGLYVGFDGADQGLLLLAQAEDGPTLSKVVRTILGWVEMAARNGGQRTPFEMIDYRGHRIARFDMFALGRVEEWLVASTHLPLLQQAMDRLIDHTSGGWTNSPIWRAALSHRDPGADVWVVAHLDAPRRQGFAAELFSGQTDNALAELLLGGVLDAFRHAPWASASLSVQSATAELRFDIPCHAAQRSAARDYFFAADQEGKPARRIEVSNRVGHIFARRDLQGWWQSKEDLFAENIVAELLQADSQFSILFAGLDFGKDILGAVEPGLQIVIARPQFDDSMPPELKLPAFALVGRLREPGEIKRRLRIAYQSVIGFVNIQLAMDGYPQLDLVTESRDGVECSAATYVIDARSPKGLVHYNFSPALAFRDDLLILSSSRELAWQIAQPGAVGDPIDAATSFSIEIDSQAVADLLHANRQLLAMQTMLQQGSRVAEAEEQIALILDVVRWVEALSSRLEVHQDRLTWRAKLQFAQ